MEFFKDIYRIMEGKVFFVESNDIPYIQGGVSESGERYTVYVGDVDDTAETRDMKFAVAQHLLRFATFEYLTLGISNQISDENLWAIRGFTNLIAVYLMAQINPDFLDETLKEKVIVDAVDDLGEYPLYSAALEQAISNEPGLNNLRQHIGFFAIAVENVWKNETVGVMLGLFSQGYFEVDSCFNNVSRLLRKVAEFSEKKAGRTELLISDYKRLIDYFPREI